MKQRLAMLGLVPLSGAAWALAFEAKPTIVLPWLALVPFLWVLDRARLSALSSFLLGWLHGVAYWLVAVPWIAPTVETFGGVPRPVSWLALVAASLILGVWHGVFALLVRPWLAGDPVSADGRYAGLSTCLGVPAAWVLSEWMRGHVPAFAFPWNLAGYAWIDIPGALELSAWIGSYGLSFLLVLANTGITLAVSRRKPMVAVWALSVPIVVLVAGALFGGSPAEADPDAAVIEVALIQPGGRLLGDETDTETAFGYLLEESRAVCGGAQAARLLVWPESAAFPYGWETSPRLRSEVASLTRNGCRVLLNAPLRLDAEGRDQAGGYENAALLIGANGVVGTYAKQRLVPFGEYVPLAGLLPMLGPLARIDEAFRPGQRGSVLHDAGEGLDRVGLGMAICYEVTFPALVARGVRDGAGVLVTITNDAWYGDSSAPHQHLRAARFRAAENGRPLVRAALTGISAVIDVNGRTVESLGVGEVGRIETTVVARDHLTPFARAPWLVPAASLLLAVSLGMIRRRQAVSRRAAAMSRRR